MINKLAGFLSGALLFCTSNVFAATVTLNGSNGATSCTYSTISVAADSSVVATCTGGGGGGSTSATFAVIAPGTTTVNNGISVSVSRTIGVGGQAGNDTVTVTSTGLVGSFSPNPATVTFSQADGTSTVTKSAGSVSFASAGTAQLGLSGTSQAVTAASVVVSQGSGCAAGPANSWTLGMLPTGAGTTYLLPPASSNDYPVGAFQFTVPSSDQAGKSYTFGFEITVNGNFNGKEVAISTCPGDFSAIGMSAGVGQCYVSNTSAFDGIRITVGSGCSVTPGGTYYLNVRGKAKGDTQGFVLTIT